MGMRMRKGRKYFDKYYGGHSDKYTQDILKRNPNLENVYNYGTTPFQVLETSDYTTQPYENENLVHPLSLAEDVYAYHFGCVKSQISSDGDVHVQYNTQDLIGSYVYQTPQKFRFCFHERPLSTSLKLYWLDFGNDPDTIAMKNRIFRCPTCNTLCPPIRYATADDTKSNTYKTRKELETRNAQIQKLNTYLANCVRSIESIVNKKSTIGDYDVTMNSYKYPIHTMSSTRNNKHDYADYECTNSECKRYGLSILMRSCVLLHLKQGDTVDLTAKSEDGAIELVIPPTIWTGDDDATSSVPGIFILDSLENNVVVSSK